MICALDLALAVAFHSTLLYVFRALCIYNTCFTMYISHVVLIWCCGTLAAGDGREPVGAYVSGCCSEEYPQF